MKKFSITIECTIDPKKKTYMLNIEEASASGKKLLLHEILGVLVLAKDSILANSSRSKKTDPQ